MNRLSAPVRPSLGRHINLGWLAFFERMPIGSFQLDLEILPLHFELGNRVLFHQVDDGFDIF